MRIYLIGYMGSGKSTLGTELAQAFGISRIDLDEEFELRYKISITNFFTKYGENTFRELENKLLLEFSTVPDIILSTGGGTPCFYGNMNLMNSSGITVYLSATPELLLTRIGSSTRKRPLLKNLKGENTLQKISQHLQSRIHYYEKANITIDALSPDVAQLKNTILLYMQANSGE